MKSCVLSLQVSSLQDVCVLEAESYLVKEAKKWVAKAAKDYKIITHGTMVRLISKLMSQRFIEAVVLSYIEASYNILYVDIFPKYIFSESVSVLVLVDSWDSNVIMCQETALNLQHQNIDCILITLAPSTVWPLMALTLL